MATCFSYTPCMWMLFLLSASMAPVDGASRCGSSQSSGGKAMWKPDSRFYDSRETWVNTCFRQSKEAAQRYINNCEKLRKCSNSAVDTSEERISSSTDESCSFLKCLCVGDSFYSDEQVRSGLAACNLTEEDEGPSEDDPGGGGGGGGGHLPGQAKKRVKRKIRTFTNFPVAKWPTTIHYKIDGNIADYQVKSIYKALDMWQSTTCLTFVELNVTARFDDQHLIFLKTGYISGCYSFIGRGANRPPQPIYLSYGCFMKPGTIAHEIGHSLGLFHEHQRRDRDDHITVVKDNIIRDALPNFSIIMAQFIDNMNVPYDHASAMHYKPEAFTSNGRNTIQTVDPLYQNIIGQRLELSFTDIQIINRAYCNATCNPNWLRAPCQNGGYQDPKACHQCRCPHGWSGRYCNEIQPSKNVKEECGGIRESQYYSQSIQSPGYDKGNYSDFQECYWLIKTKPGETITVKFEGDFGIYMTGYTCEHWVELRYGADLGKTGPRFCGYETPENKLVSEGDMILINFKAIWSSHSTKQRRGFRLTYQTVATCADHPCWSGGTCVPLFADFTCLCPYGIGGKFCDRVAYPADVAILFDTSNNAGKNINMMKYFTKNFVNKIHFGSERTRIALIDYNRDARLVSYFNQEKSLSEIHDKIDNLQQPAEWHNLANLYAAMWLMRFGLQGYRSMGDRREVKNFVLVITDSPFPDENIVPKNMIFNGAQLLKEAGIGIFVIGIGPRVDKTNLISITGDERFLYTVPSFHDLFSQDVINQALSRFKTLVNTVWGEETADVDLVTPSRIYPPSRIPPTSSTRMRTTTIEKSTTTTDKPTTTTEKPTTTTKKSTTTTEKQTTTTKKPTTTTEKPTSTTEKSTTTTEKPTTTTEKPTTTTEKPTTTTKKPTTTTEKPTTTTEKPTTTTEKPTTTTEKPTTTTKKPTTTTEKPTTTTKKPTTTTKKPTTTTKKPTTTTKKPTTTTEKPPTTSKASPTLLSCGWVPGDGCSHACGGCGVMKYNRTCTYSDGTTKVIYRHEVACNIHKCPEWGICEVYIAGRYFRQCEQPACCPGYVLRGSKCFVDRRSDRI